MLESSDAQKNCITKRCQDATKKHFYCCVGMVEINTIASGFGHLGPSSARLQRQINLFYVSVLEFIFFCKYLFYKNFSRVLFQEPFQKPWGREKIIYLHNQPQFFSPYLVLVLQTIALGLFRSDYFNCSFRNKILQVEFNTIASSFGGLSSQFRDFHRFLLLFVNTLHVHKTELFRIFVKFNFLLRSPFNLT